MKKTQLLITALCASALVLGACTPKKPGKKNKSSSQTAEVSNSAAPSGSSTPSGKTLTGIAITTGPTKTTYQVGESFDPTGMVVTASYSDGSSENVTSQCTFNPSVMAAGTTSVTVSFGGQSQTQTVTVSSNDWTAAQKAVFAQYLHGFTDVPYLYVAGATVERDAEYACVSYHGGTSSLSLLESYVALFDSSWNMKKMEDDYIPYYGLSYSGEKEITVDEESYTISVSLYGYDGEEITEDGSGTFYLDIKDGFYYSWDEFQEDYQETLTYFYDTYESEDDWFPMDFPDTINYEGDLDCIEVEEDYDDEGYELLFYCAYMYGVGLSDIEEFLGKFDLSDKWVAYVDSSTFSDGPADAYYHVSEKLAITYVYYEQSEVFLMIIHQFTPISWPTDKVSEYIAGINSTTSVVVPSLDLESSRYITEEEDGELAVMVLPSDGADNSTLDAYAALFAEGWLVEKIVEDEEKPEEYFYSALSNDHAVDVQFGLQAYSDAPEQHYVVIMLAARPALTSALPQSSVVSYYAGNDVVVESVPAFTIAAATGGFSTEATDDYVLISAFEATDDEFSSFLAGFTSPWVVDSENTDASKGQYAFIYGETLACVYISDGRQAQGYHYIQIDFELRDWNKTQKESFAEHLLGVVPPFIPEFSGMAYNSTYDVFTTGQYLIGDLHESIVGVLTGAGWTLLDTEVTTADDEEHYGTHYYYSTPAGTYGRAVCEIDVVYYSATYPTVTGCSIFFEQTDWSPEEKSAFETALKGVVPPYLGAIWASATTATHFEGSRLYTEAGLAQFDEIITEADGWLKTGTGAEAYFTKQCPGGEGYVKISFKWYSENGSEGYYWCVDFVAASAA